MFIKKSILALGIMLGAAATSSMAADIEAGVVKNTPEYSATVEDSAALLFSSSDLEGIESRDMPETDAGISIDKTGKEASLVMTRAAANGITYFEIAGVQSVSYPSVEVVSANQTSTVQNHGGGQVRVFVWQYGYGNTNNATFAGSSVSSTSSTPRCGSNLHVCSSGETVTGFLHQFDFFGPANVSGQVVVSANSIASPFGYWSDSLYIQ